ncbi:MAG: fibronectin type III domain-containing protein [Cellulomonas sp.]
MSVARISLDGRRARAAAAVVLAVGLIGVNTVGADAIGGPTVGGGTGSYTEQASPTLIGQDVTVTGGGSFAGQFLDFAVSGAASSEALSLQMVGSPVTTNGVVSVVGGSVYLGNGTTADIIGSINGTNDGQAGRALRVDFTSAFVNAGFEANSLTGWTAINQQIDLGVTAIAGSTTVDTSTYPGTVTNQDNNVPQSLGSLTSVIQSSIVSDGSYALQLESSGMTTLVGCDVVHGPAVYSSPFEAAAGDSIFFDWRAYAGDDNYHVFGYLLDQSGNQLEVLDSTGAGTTAWSTKETVIPSSGTYRFVFVSGTFDASCGKAAGASLVIDNVRVYGTKAVDVVVQQIARLLTYANSSDNPPATRTVSVTAQSTFGSGSASIAVAITPVDDAPTFGALAPMTVTNNEGVQTYANITGTATSTDPEGDTPSYALVGGAPDVQTIGAVAYTESVTGTYGTMHLNATTGAYVLVANATAIDGRLTDDTESFAVTVTTNALSASSAIVLNVDVPPSAPGAPTGLGLVPGAEQIAAVWTAPSWLGGSAVDHYVVQISTDGTSWTTAVTTADATPSATITGLTNGASVQVRVLAVNATGTSVAGAVEAATPVNVPGAPTALGATPGNGVVSLAWTAPADVGGTPITGYQIEKSLDGSTWTVAVADTGSTATSRSITGLANGTLVTFRVSAINAVGTGAAGDPAAATPRTVPGAPTDLSLVPADGAATASWQAPTDDGGNAVTAYRVQTSTDGTTWVTVTDTAATSSVVTGLTNGDAVQVRVLAINEAGPSVPSASATSTPRTVPGAPTITGVAIGNRSLTITFAPPASTGGATILTYQYSLDGGTNWVARHSGSTASPMVIGGLTNGQAYAVLIRAVNEAGSGSASSSHTGTPELAPIPVAGLLGPVIPELTPGRTVLEVDGETAVVQTGTAGGAWTAGADGFTVSLQPVTPGGGLASVDPTTGLITMTVGGSVRVSGTGFLSGSTVDVWLFSTPYLLGEVVVGADGSFAATLPLPAGVAAGEHTIQLNGVSQDEMVRSLSTGVVIQAVPASARASSSSASSGSLAQSGADPLGLVLVDLALLLLGTALVFARSHRRSRRG